MKKLKLLSIIAFFTILLFASDVNAEPRQYGFLNCSKKRWSMQNNCTQFDAMAEVKDAVITIDYNENGSLSFSLTDDAFDNDANVSNNELKKESDNVYYIELAGTNGQYGLQQNKIRYVYDLSLLAKYYSQAKIVPRELIILNESKIGSTYNHYYYFGVSEYELLEKQNSGNYDLIYFSAETDRQLSEINSCVDLVYYMHVFEEKVAKLGADSDEVNAYAAELENTCLDYVGYNKDPNNSCYSLCRDIENSIADMGVDIFNETNSCGFGERMVAWIIRVLKLLRFIVPTLVIVLTTYEYINAFMAAEDDALKKVGGRLGKRLFIMILFFVLPSLIQFILNVFNVPGFDSSNPYCIK